MDRLLDGYRRFRVETWPGERERYRMLAAEGQQPEAVVVACSDSRVDPQTVFGAVPGQLFVVRNVAGLVPPYAPDAGYHGTSAAIEYGVRVLGARRIIVLGHAQCGGVRAMVEGTPEAARDFLEPWLALARPALPPGGGRPFDDMMQAYELAIVRLTLANLATFPWIASAVAAGQLTLEGFRFAIHTGVLSRLTEDGLLPVA